MIDPKSYMILKSYPQDPMTKLFYYNLDKAVNEEVVDYFVDTTNEVLAENNIDKPNLVFIEGLSALAMAIMQQNSYNHVIMLDEKSPLTIRVNRMQIPVKLPPMPDRPTIVIMDSLLYKNTYQSITGLLRIKITKPIYYVTHNTNLSYTNIRTMLEVNLKGII